MPEVVQARLAGVWAEAVQARPRPSTSGPPRGWLAQLEQVEAERDEAISAADDHAAAHPTRRDPAQLTAQLTALQEQLHAIETLRHDLEVAHTARAQTRGDTAGARGEATVLREEVTRLRAEQAAVSDTVK